MPSFPVSSGYRDSAAMLWVRRGPRVYSDSPVRSFNGEQRHSPGSPHTLLSSSSCPPQFTKRVQLLLMPAKHQPDLLLLRHVPLSRVHLFTAIQLACLGLLWIVKSTPAAIIFPIMVTQGWAVSRGLLGDSASGRVAKASIRGRLFPLSLAPALPGWEP